MTLTTRILNAPATVRRTLTIAIAAFLVLIVLWLILLAFEVLYAARDDVQDKRETLGQLNAIIALAKSVQTEPKSEAPNSQDFLAGENEAIVRSNLQARLNNAARTSGAVVMSAGNVAALVEDGITYLGVRANLTGPLEGVHNTILELETTPPLLFVREATIRRVTAQPANGSSSDLFAEVTFYGAMRTDAASSNQDTKP